MSKKFVVAKIGVNAKEATDPNDFIFHSDYNTFKIIVEDTLQVTLAASTNNQSFTVSHGPQNFIPLVAAFAKQESIAGVFLPNSENVEFYGVKLGWTGSGVRFNYVSANDSLITFNFNNTNPTSKVVNIRYLVLEKVT